MLIEPRPAPPYLPIYDEPDKARVQAQYEMAEREWQRRRDRVMWMNAIPVVCGCVGLAIAVLVGPSIVLDAILILSR